MDNLPTRFHRLKLVLVSILLTIGGAMLIALDKAQDQETGWLALVPWGEIGGVIVGAGLLSIWLDYLFRQEQQAVDDLRLRAILRDQAPVMRDAVLEAFAANKPDLERVATPATLDRIITTSLGLRLHDEDFAAEIYTDVKSQVVEAAERWTDVSVAIDVTPAGNAGRATDYFDVTVRWEYTTIPIHAQRRFICLSDRDEYSELARSRGSTSAWYLKPGQKFSANEREAYELLQFAVNGQDRTIRRSTRKNYQAYAADIGSGAVESGEPVTISYTYRTLTKKSGHLLFFDIEQPTRDLKMVFDYTGTDITSISAIDQIPSIRETRIEHSPDGVPAKTVRVEVDGWTFPRSGVAFVWTLNKEL
jgi:hypothetical protein